MNKEKTILAGVWALIAAGNGALAVCHGRASDKVNAVLHGISAGCAAVCAGLNFAAALPGTAEERKAMRRCKKILRILRRESGMTIAEIAEKSGVPEAALERAARGKYIADMRERLCVMLLCAALVTPREREKQDEKHS